MKSIMKVIVKNEGEGRQNFTKGKCVDKILALKKQKATWGRTDMVLEKTYYKKGILDLEDEWHGRAFTLRDQNFLQGCKCFCACSY